MNINTAFPTKYVSAADLQGQEVSVTMSHVVMEQMDDDDTKSIKPVLYFQGMQKGLVLNKTNAGSIVGWYGEETDFWPGQSIILYSARVEAFGKMTDAIRLKRDFSKPAQPIQPQPSQVAPQPPSQPVAAPQPAAPQAGGVSF